MKMPKKPPKPRPKDWIVVRFATNDESIAAFGPADSKEAFAIEVDLGLSGYRAIPVQLQAYEHKIKA